VRISDNIKIAKNWQKLATVFAMRFADNKTALFHFLTQSPFAEVCTKTVLMTCDTNVVQFGESVDTSEISPCSQEVDTRLMLHCLHAATHGGATENAGLENAAPDCRGGKRGSRTLRIGIFLLYN